MNKTKKEQKIEVKEEPRIERERIEKRCTCGAIINGPGMCSICGKWN